MIQVLDTIYFIDDYYKIHSGLVTEINHSNNTQIEFIDVATKKTGNINISRIFLKIEEAMFAVNKQILKAIEIKKDDINTIYNDIERLKTKMFEENNLDISEERFINYIIINNINKKKYTSVEMNNLLDEISLYYNLSEKIKISNLTKYVRPTTMIINGKHVGGYKIKG